MHSDTKWDAQNTVDQILWGGGGGGGGGEGCAYSPTPKFATEGWSWKEISSI